jgi:hypothetical protein
MLMRKMLLSLAVVMLAACLGRADAGVGVEVKLWRPELETKIESSVDALDGTDISLEDDIDIDSKDDVVWMKISLGESHRLTFTYMKVEFSGEANPELNFNFGGESYSVDVEVKTKLESTIYRIAWEADWWHTKMFSFGTIIGTEIFDTEISVSNSIVGTEKVDVNVPVPILGVQGQLTLPYGFGVYGEVAGLYLGYGKFEGGFIEWEIGAKYSIAEGRLYAMVGYRALNVKLEEDDEKAEIDLGGLTFGIGVKF